MARVTAERAQMTRSGLLEAADGVLREHGFAGLTTRAVATAAGAPIQAIVRRAKGHSEAVIRTGLLNVNLDTHSVEVSGRPLHLTGKEYGILELLSLRKRTTLTKEMFLNHLYGGMDEPEIKIIDVFICKLRKKLSGATGGDNYIETVWGRGYVLRDPQPEEGAADEPLAVRAAG